MADYTDSELIELFDERAAVREFDGMTEAELGRMTEAQRVAHRRAAEQAAYWDLKKLVGSIKLPTVICDMARKFRSE